MDHQSSDSHETLELRPKIPISGGLNPRMVVLAVALIAGLVGLSFLAGIRSSNRLRDRQDSEPELRTAQPLASVQNLPGAYSDIPKPHPEPAEPVVATPEPAEPLVDPELAKRFMEESDAARTSSILFSAVSDHLPESEGNGASQELVEPASMAFTSALSGIEPYLNQTLQRPRSPFEIKAGSVIPAVLITAINSDLPGDVVARVTEPLYDTVTGHHRLIPPGAVLYGAYDDVVENGQDRILVVWQRLIMPDGRSVQLEGMAGVDARGQAGLPGKVDHHFDKLIGGVVLSTLLSFGGNLARNDDADRGHGDVIGDTVAQEASRVGQRVVERQLNVRPTITVPEGTRVNVLVNKDIVLAPYPER